MKWQQAHSIRYPLDKQSPQACLYSSQTQPPTSSTFTATSRLILLSPKPAAIYELVRGLSEARFDVLLLHAVDKDTVVAVSPDLLIVDALHFSLSDSYALVEQLCFVHPRLPSLILLPENEQVWQQKAAPEFNYLYWPTDIHNALTIIHRLLRVSTPDARAQLDIVRIGYKDLLIDTPRRAVYREGMRIEFTKTEYDILHSLVSAHGAVLTRDDIAELVWGENQFIMGSNVVDVHIRSLRKKLGDRAASPRYIETVRGIGYRLAEE